MLCSENLPTIQVFKICHFQAQFIEKDGACGAGVLLNFPNCFFALKESSQAFATYYR